MTGRTKVYCFSPREHNYHIPTDILTATSDETTDGGGLVWHQKDSSGGPVAMKFNSNTTLTRDHLKVN